MTVRAYVKDDWERGGMEAVVVLETDVEGRTAILDFSGVTVTLVNPEVVPDRTKHLRLDEPVGRALYEALARHFGGHATDVTALRQDYDHERRRVDTLIKAATNLEVPRR